MPRPRPEEIEPKPFAFVEIPRTSPRKTEYIRHNKFRDLTGSIRFQLRVLSDYLFVGSGLYDLRESDNLVYYSFFRSNEQIVIPSTSIKGAVRSVLEAISNSCVVLTKKRERVGQNHQACKWDEKKKQASLCPACGLFGTTGYGGRVRFSDAIPLGSVKIAVVKIGELFQPRVGKPEYRKFYEQKQFVGLENQKPEKGYRFVEAVPEKSIFECTLTFENLAEAELALILASMGIDDKQFRIKIGGAKPRCFGTVEFTPINADIQTSVFETKHYEGNELKKYIEDILAKRNLIQEELRKQYVSEVTAHENENCPKFLY